MSEALRIEEEKLLNLISQERQEELIKKLQMELQEIDTNLKKIQKEKDQKK